MVSNAETPQPFTIVGIGEALFDCFPHGAFLGGAPVNFVVHANQLLRQLGGNGFVVSARGEDDLGQQLIQEITSRGLSADHIQVTTDFPTGTVQVSVDKTGHPEYEITQNVAWDHIEYLPATSNLAASCSAVCFGTLAQRSPSSRETIRQFLATATNALRMCDLNLRQEFYDRETIEASFSAANVVKLSEEELDVATSSLKAEGDDPDLLALQLCERFDLKLLAVTRGARGTVLYGDGQRFEGQVPNFPRDSQADSVGAGDSCSAAIVVGLLLEWHLDKIVALANRVGAFVASQQGATPKLPDEILAMVTCEN